MFDSENDHGGGVVTIGLYVAKHCTCVKCLLILQFVEENNVRHLFAQKSLLVEQVLLSITKRNEF